MIDVPSTTAFRSPESKSAALFARAQASLPGGSSRATIFRDPYPPYMSFGRGARIIDVEGEERLDFVNNYTSLIHGHAHPAILAAVAEAAGRGTAYSFPTTLEIELAERVTSRLPSAERVRFTNSGTEAVMLAIRLARAATGRDRIAKFEGAYHGAYDDVNVSLGPTAADRGPLDRPNSVLERGLGRGSQAAVLTLPFNEPEIAADLIVANASELAAVIVDPSPLRAGMPEPRPGFLELLRSVTRKHGIVLIFDEVISFRVGPGGLQGELGLDPDLTTLGKIIGGGLPVGAVAGSAALLDQLDRRRATPVDHGGTFNANPVTMAAGIAALDLMTTSEYERINALASTLGRGIQRAFAASGWPLRMRVLGSLFMIGLRGDEVHDYRSLRSDPDAVARTAQFAAALLDRGVVLTPNGMGCISTAMNPSDIDAFVRAARDAASSVYDRMNLQPAGGQA